MSLLAGVSGIGLLRAKHEAGTLFFSDVEHAHRVASNSSRLHFFNFARLVSKARFASVDI